MIEDRKKGFDLAKAPLLRLYLIRLEDNVYQFLWSFHHLLTDGWSIPIILKEFLMIYEMKSKGLPIQLPPTRPYRDYINWLQKQNIETAKTYWKTVLKDFAGPSQLNIGRPKGFERDVEDTYEKFLSHSQNPLQTNFSTGKALQCNAQLFCAGSLGHLIKPLQ